MSTWKISPPTGGRNNPWAVRDAATNEVVAVIPSSTSSVGAEEIARQIVSDHNGGEKTRMNLDTFAAIARSIKSEAEALESGLLRHGKP